MLTFMASPAEYFRLLREAVEKSNINACGVDWYDKAQRVIQWNDQVSAERLVAQQEQAIQLVEQGSRTFSQAAWLDRLRRLKGLPK